MLPPTPRAPRWSGLALADLVAQVLRPAACLACDRPGAWPCCAACLPPEPSGAGPWRLAADPQLTLWALGPYRGALRAAVLAGKLRAQPAALTVLGRRLGATMAAAGVGADLVTWVPAAAAGGLPRDHARRVAAGVAAALDLPAVRLLAPAPGRDLGRDRGAGRAAAARPAPRPWRRLAGGRVLVVDDVATTGATLAGAAATLRQAGARRVEAAVLAAAVAAFGPPPGRAAPVFAQLNAAQPGCDPVGPV
jgi:predicted amidophosphoribosyltransferase